MKRVKETEGKMLINTYKQAKEREKSTRTQLLSTSQGATAEGNRKSDGFDYQKKTVKNVLVVYVCIKWWSGHPTEIHKKG